MKLASFQVQTRVGRFNRIGAVQDNNTLIDLTSSYVALLDREGRTNFYGVAETIVPSDMKAFVEGGDFSLKEAGRAVDYVLHLPTGASSQGPRGESLVFGMDEVSILPPLSHPNSLRDFILFENHFRRAYDAMGIEPPEAWYRMPIYYKGNPAAMIGHGQDLEWPAYTEKLDYELEMGLVVGKAGKNISQADAKDHIYGFCCMNDFSARDIQMDEMSVRLGPAKGKDFATSIGPWIVTIDEAGDFHSLEMYARVNGELWSQGNTREMFHSWERMIEHVSWEETIYPTDIMGSGTANRGCGLEIDRWLKPGDTIEIEIENLGILSNKIVRR